MQFQCLGFSKEVRSHSYSNNEIVLIIGKIISCWVLVISFGQEFSFQCIPSFNINDSFI